MKYLFLVVAFVVASAHAQNMKLLSGSLKPLKGQRSYDIRFGYDSMVVGEVMNERVYLAEKKRAWDEKQPGRGSDFVQFWFEDRKRLYEPSFVKSFEKYSRSTLYVDSAKFTLILKTTRTEGGWNLGITNHGGEIDGELWVVESADPKKVIAKIGFYHFRSKNFFGGDFEMTQRIAPAYELAGHGLGDYIRRKSK